MTPWRQLGWPAYPRSIPSAKASLDAIALIDARPCSPHLPRLTLMRHRRTPVVTKVVGKGLPFRSPKQLPTKKLDVIEYATDLLMEGSGHRIEIPSADRRLPLRACAGPAGRRLHAQTILPDPAEPA